MSSNSSKPRLKLSINGRVSLVAAGSNGWTEEVAKSWVQKHYGSLAHFSRRYGFDYLHVVNAFQRRQDAAGGIAEVRQLLGLKSQPTAASIAQVEAQQRRWNNRFAAHQSSRALERLDRQSASAGCVGSAQIENCA